MSTFASTHRIPTDLSGYVPYSGATGNVDLGANDLTCNTLNYTTLNPAIAAGGADTQIQYNDSGAFGADAGFTTDKAGSITLTGTGQFDAIGLGIAPSAATKRLNIGLDANDQYGFYIDGTTTPYTDTAALAVAYLKRTVDVDPSGTQVNATVFHNELDYDHGFNSGYSPTQAITSFYNKIIQRGTYSGTPGFWHKENIIGTYNWLDTRSSISTNSGIFGGLLRSVIGTENKIDILDTITGGSGNSVTVYGTKTSINFTGTQSVATSGTAYGYFLTVRGGGLWNPNNGYGVRIDVDNFDEVAWGIHITGDGHAADCAGIVLDADGDVGNILFGAAQDASISYDGTDLLITPDEVGSGSVNVKVTQATTTIPFKIDQGTTDYTSNDDSYGIWMDKDCVRPTYPSGGGDTYGMYLDLNINDVVDAPSNIKFTKGLYSKIYDTTDLTGASTFTRSMDTRAFDFSVQWAGDDLTSSGATSKDIIGAIGSASINGCEINKASGSASFTVKGIQGDAYSSNFTRTSADSYNVVTTGGLFSGTAGGTGIGQDTAIGVQGTGLNGGTASTGGKFIGSTSSNSNVTHGRGIDTRVAQGNASTGTITNASSVYAGPVDAEDGIITNGYNFFGNTPEVDGGTFTTFAHIWLNDATVAGTNYGIVIDSDTLGLNLGQGQDASIYYDGTDMQVNPKEVGTGAFLVSGDIGSDNFKTRDADTGGTNDVFIGTEMVGVYAGSNNVFIGAQSGEDCTSGAQNVAIGYLSGTSLTEGDRNFFLGAECGSTITTGDRNIGIGYNALRNAGATVGGVFGFGYEACRYLTNSTNIGVGNYAVKGINGSATGTGNCGLGQSTLRDLTSGRYNNAFGYASGLGIAGGYGNTFMGYYTGGATTGDYNICVGYETGKAGLTTADKCIVIGYDLEPDDATTDGQFNIGNLIKGNLTAASQWLQLGTEDNAKTYWGAAKDASIYYDGTDMIINSDDVGSGGCKINSLNIRADGTIQPVSMADGSAANDSIYYSTTASKLVYKDSGGTVNNLY